MADRDDTDRKPPRAATPLSPTEQAVVRGNDVTFAWEPVPEATEYRLEVATDPEFQQLVYEKTLADTRHYVEDLFNDDEVTYYWRVFSLSDDGAQSAGETVESFISPATTAADTPPATDPPTAKPAPAYADDVPERPREEEDLGPAAELVKATAAGAAAEVTGEPEFYAEEAEMGVQHEGIGVAQILGFVFAIIAVIAMAIVFIIQITNIESDRTRIESAAALFYPELRDAEALATTRLSQYDVIDADRRVYRMPIEEAMERLVEEGAQDGTAYSPELQLLPPR